MNLIFYPFIFHGIIIKYLFTESFPLWCRFYPHNEYGYTCIGMEIEIFSKDNRTVTSVRGAPLSGRNTSDVTYFSIFNRPVYYFPKGVNEFFKTIINIQIYETQLKEITQDDLKPFGNSLKMLCLIKNNLTNLDTNLFEFNQNLENLNLTKNHFKVIDAKLFENLQHLKFFDVSNNFCTSSNDVATSSSDVKRVVENIKINCSALV